jgi:hypothetical protein
MKGERKGWSSKYLAPSYYALIVFIIISEGEVNISNTITPVSTPIVFFVCIMCPVH